MTIVSIVPIVIGLLLTAFLGEQTKPPADVWQPFNFFVGKWEGTGNGKPGVSTIRREYRPTLNDKFIHVHNVATYEPQPKNPKGEIHEDWGTISFDKNRKQFVFPQFHVEGFVNQYVTTSISDDGKAIVFTSQSIENIPAGWRARETYKIVGLMSSLRSLNWQDQVKISKFIVKAILNERNNRQEGKYKR